MIMADESDRASMIELHNTEEAVKKTLAKIERPPEDFDGSHCVDCGEAIDPRRVALGGFRDLYCQERYERQFKLTKVFYD